MDFCFARAPNLSFRQQPSTDDEKAVARVFETFAEKAIKNARGLSGLYTEDAEIRWFYGTWNEPGVTKGRQNIYAYLSIAAAQKLDIRDLLLKAEGDRAEATGWTAVLISASAMTFLHEGGGPGNFAVSRRAGASITKRPGIAS